MHSGALNRQRSAGPVIPQILVTYSNRVVTGFALPASCITAVVSIMAAFSGATMSSDDLAQIAHERLGDRVLAGPEGAVAIFERALRRDPASAYRWCDLAEALLEAGQINRAERCLAGALEYGPGLPPILMRAANFCFRAGETERALAYAAQILGTVRDYDAAIFGLYDRMGVTTEAALRKGVPPSPRAARAYFRHLLSAAPDADIRLAWSWMEARSLADDSARNEYDLRLVKAHEYVPAKGGY